MHTNRTSLLALVAFAVTVGVVSLAGASAPSEAPVEPAPAGPVVPDVVGLTERDAFLERMPNAAISSREISDSALSDFSKRVSA